VRRTRPNRWIRVAGMLGLALLLLLVAGIVFAGDQLTLGLNCPNSTHVATMTSEVDLDEITAKSPEDAIEDEITGNGADGLGLTYAPKATLIDGFQHVATEEGTFKFEYIDEAGNNISDVLVEAVGDGRYFVSSARFCA
jgi:hypothetical protein